MSAVAPAASNEYADLFEQVSALARAAFEAWLATPEHLAAHSDLAHAVMVLSDATASLRELTA